MSGNLPVPATCDSQGLPSPSFALLRAIGKGGFCFFDVDLYLDILPALKGRGFLIGRSLQVVPVSQSGLAAPALHRHRFGPARPYYPEFWFL